jgi:tetratricopeptide (TPR) repeat protein
LRPVTLAQLHYSRARLHLQRQARDAAVRDLAEAARLASNDRSLASRAEADRGRVLHLQGRFAEALAAYDAALKADPNRIDVLLRRGEVLLALPQARYADAAAMFDTYLERGGAPSVAIFRQRGHARAKLDRHAEAIDDFSRALEAKPKAEERPLLYLSRGLEYLAVNALMPALGDFEEVLRLQPDSAEAYLGRSYVRVKQGDLQKGMEDADRAVKGDPKEPGLWHGAARVYAQAATQRKTDKGAEESQGLRRTRYQWRAMGLLQQALSLVPAGERAAYWRDKVLKDPALVPLRGLPQYDRLAARYGGQDR